MGGDIHAASSPQPTPLSRRRTMPFSCRTPLASGTVMREHLDAVTEPIGQPLALVLVAALFLMAGILAIWRRRPGIFAMVAGPAVRLP
jgi:hypothetical protein